MEFKKTEKSIRYTEYDGKRFYKDNRGYWIGQKIDESGKSRIIRLHIYVWEKFNGPVPDGCDIHHIDHDTSNNDLSNLVAIPRTEHHKLHMARRDKSGLAHILEVYARPKSAKWHRSEAGRQWHKEHYKSSMAPYWDEQVTKTCEYCGKEFRTPVLMKESAKYCSNNCKSAARRRSGVDNEERICRICGSIFITNKYSRAELCSKECANISQSRKKTGVYHPKKTAP